jgi:hypothetical protein
MISPFRLYLSGRKRWLVVGIFKGRFPISKLYYSIYFYEHSFLSRFSTGLGAELIEPASATFALLPAVIAACDRGEKEQGLCQVCSRSLQTDSK